MLTKNDILEQLRQKRPELESRFKVKRIGIFGSYACDEQTEDSDIDVLVEFSEPVGFEFFDLKEWLEYIFGKEVDLATKGALKDLIRDQILSEVVYS